ncbi:MAG: RNA ligase family protein [Coxiellaceae bacterium]|nr:RNA ligase family protein [Coxiellaceae bacterium]
MSIFRVEIVPVVLEPHPNADSLSIVKVFDYTVCVRTADWNDKAIGAYIPPDSVVPNDERFAFLQGKTRIKVRKLRGVVSMGLLISAPEGSKIGDDVTALLGVTHYEPPLQNATTHGQTESPPKDLIAPTYDVENMLRYASLFEKNELVHVTEKIHGANGRFVWHQDRMWCGSKNEWKKPDLENLWWRALSQNPWLEDYCRQHPGDVVYGEVFGSVQSLRYGLKLGHYQIRVFDIMRAGRYLPLDVLLNVPNFQLVPSLGVHPFDIEQLKALAEGDSLIEGANHMREGIVVRPQIDRFAYEISGRLQLKIISNAYLEWN